MVGKRRKLTTIIICTGIVSLCVQFYFAPSQKRDNEEGGTYIANFLQTFSEVNPIRESHNDNDNDHVVAGLSCEKYGGPPDEIAAEMIYWEDIPSDARYIGPLKEESPSGKTKYLTFEPDEGGWNNIRMAMETATTMALAMGRTLVMPPEFRFYLLWESAREEGKHQKYQFSFHDFFHFSSIENEHKALDIISFEEFLKKEAMTGKLRDTTTGKISFPPFNRTDWNRKMDNWQPGRRLYNWLRSISANVQWDYDKCIVTFPSKPGAEGVHELQKVWDLGCCNNSARKRLVSFDGNPVMVNASSHKRLEELLAHRRENCMYNTSLQQEKVLHLRGDNNSIRMLVHFYAFLFFQDWKQDLWIKRFVRDHLRYIDEIQCAAARIVRAMRQASRENGDPTGAYDSMHIRRADFQYDMTRLSPEEYYLNARNATTEGATVFIATDDPKNKTHFEVLQKHYRLYFLHDFRYLLKDVNTNFYGMIDQLVASRGRSFVGTYYSTFSGYINRLRGYHSQKQRLEGYRQGIIRSYYFVTPGKNKFMHQEYQSVKPPVWGREFPIAWRDIDLGIEELHS